MKIIYVFIINVLLYSCSFYNYDEKTIMPLGDSITVGIGSNIIINDESGGYRTPLRELLNGKYSFVGSQNNGPVNTTNNFHEGHSGYYIKGHDYNGTFGKGIYENITEWLNDANPDIILLHIGTNTLAANYIYIDGARNALVELKDLIDLIYYHSPDTILIASSIIGINENKNIELSKYQFELFKTCINDYNTGIPLIVSNKKNQGYSIYFLDMFTGANLSDGDYWDMAHPNQQGYNKMALVWFNERKTIW